ncbi:protein LONGIFOLIA 1-like [Abrus precatorius]|uniref:Protein LONGIFOLIA 1-like n=1 Tax=Abrus precatorius TaxID=3816 RepID=A0A8B8L9L5_ABRPR|nr:protein LONGIFOLIA 1-like [Abrus precatorius]
MSSLEFNRTIQTESSSTNRIRIPENTNSDVSTKQLYTPVQQALDFYDIVKDSMHREAQGLSVKTVAKEGKKGQSHALKHMDSPRPLRSHKSINAGVTVASEPFHTLAKSKKTPWDSPRLSYDDSLKSVTKHKEFPRLSLDSREGSNRGFNEGNKSRNLLKGPQKGYERNSSTMPNQLQEPETSRRSSSVVAKLMGLESLPDWIQTSGTPVRNSSCSSRKHELLAISITSEDDKQHQKLALHQFRRVDSITNVTPRSRFALESTPWRQPDASQGSQLRASKGEESDTKAPKSSLTVYGEIEKRVAELEFKKSGKDLRALKQILEAMQRHKSSFEVSRDNASSSPSDNRNITCPQESLKVQTPRVPPNGQASGTVEMSNSTQGSKLPIVIMKPAKATRKANNPSSTQLSTHCKSGLSKCSPSNPTNGRLVDKQTAKGINSTTKKIKDPLGQLVCSSDTKVTKLMQSSKVPPDSVGENTINSGNITVTGSPRLQKKFGLERRSPPNSPLSDSSINRRDHNKQLVEFSSPSTTPTHKFSALQQRNERFSEINCHWRDFKHHVNVISPDFDKQRSLATSSEIEVICIDQSGNFNTPIQLSGMDQNYAFEELRKEHSKAETVVTVEQPSPVSVLDAAFYREDPPSPVKRKSDISKKIGEALSTDDDSEENSVEILKEIDQNDEKFINLNNSKDPDHKYISEILLASGLLSGHSSSQIFHSPGHLINPKLFFALEQMKTKKRHFNIEDSAKKISRIINPKRMQRKLIFDVVNDILVQKLMLDSSSILWCQSNELAGRKLKGQQLLDKLCTEIDQLQPRKCNVSLVDEDENLKHHHTNWTKCCSEMPNIVLDVERLIFKDLVTEVVRGEVAKDPGMHYRQLLFTK